VQILQMLAAEVDSTRLNEQDRIVGCFGTIIVLLVVMLVVFRLLQGKTKIQNPDGTPAIACPYCGYYLIPNDTVCPKCFKSLQKLDERTVPPPKSVAPED
jgi:hypothetical protein